MTSFVFGKKYFLIVKKTFILSENTYDITQGFTWHRGDFRAGASSLRFPLMALHLGMNVYSFVSR